MPIGEVDLVEKEIYIQKMLIMDNFSKDYKLKLMYKLLLQVIQMKLIYYQHFLFDKYE